MKTQHYCVQTVEQAMMVVVLHFGLLHGTIRGHLRNYAFIQAAEEKKGKAKKAKKKAAKAAKGETICLVSSVRLKISCHSHIVCLINATQMQHSSCIQTLTTLLRSIMPHVPYDCRQQFQHIVMYLLLT